MSNLSIKDVPEAWAEALRQRAMRNHRSLQGELMAILENAVAETAEAAGASARNSPRAPALSATRSATRQPWKPVEQVAAELRASYPQGLPSGPSSIDLIRQERDAR